MEILRLVAILLLIILVIAIGSKVIYKDNFAILTGTMSNGLVSINYPTGYNKDNCVVISTMLHRPGTASNRGYASGSTYLLDDVSAGFLVSRVELQTSGISLHGRALYLSSDNKYMDMGVDFSVDYKIILMKTGD